MIHDCKSEEDFNQLLTASKEKAAFLIKHSTACPISKGAMKKFRAMAEKEPRAQFWQVLVRENKELAQKIASETGVEHKSPQVILFYQGQAVWDCSHYAINEGNLARRLEKTIS
jgi:bacillithiol system protein YtxJ